MHLCCSLARKQCLKQVDVQTSFKAIVSHIQSDTFCKLSNKFALQNSCVNLMKKAFLNHTAILCIYSAQIDRSVCVLRCRLFAPILWSEKRLFHCLVGCKDSTKDGYLNRTIFKIIFSSNNWLPSFSPCFLAFALCSRFTPFT